MTSLVNVNMTVGETTDRFAAAFGNGRGAPSRDARHIRMDAAADPSGALRELPAASGDTRAALVEALVDEFIPEAAELVGGAVERIGVGSLLFSHPGDLTGDPLDGVPDAARARLAAALGDGTRRDISAAREVACACVRDAALDGMVSCWWPQRVEFCRALLGPSGRSIRDLYNLASRLNATSPSKTGGGTAGTPTGETYRVEDASRLDRHVFHGILAAALDRAIELLTPVESAEPEPEPKPGPDGRVRYQYTAAMKHMVIAAYPTSDGLLRRDMTEALQGLFRG